MIHSNDPTFPLFPIMSLLGCICCLIPLPWHLQAWNAGTCAFMIWTASLCLVEFINSIIWAGNVENIAPVWCDISIQIIVGAGTGIPASILCISRRLYHITSTQAVSTTRADKRRAVIIDICTAVGIPIICICLHSIVQPHRYDLFEDIGCYPPTYTTIPSFFLFYMWPPLIGAVSFVYSCLTLISFWKRRAQFAMLMSSNNALNPSRYFRLMLLAITDMLCTTPLSIFLAATATRGTPLRPWISWEDTHFGFSFVGIAPASYWRSDPRITMSLEITRWLAVFSAMIFFALFGFASEARRHYSEAFWWVMGSIGIHRPQKKVSEKRLPSWIASPKSWLSSKNSNEPPPYSPTVVATRAPHLSFTPSFGVLDISRDFNPDKASVKSICDVQMYPSLRRVEGGGIEIEIEPGAEIDLSDDPSPSTPQSDRSSTYYAPSRPTRSWYSLTSLAASSDRNSQLSTVPSDIDPFYHDRMSFISNSPRAI